jgi:hypothetical protein
MQNAESLTAEQISEFLKASGVQRIFANLRYRLTLPSSDTIISVIWKRPVTLTSNTVMAHNLSHSWL